jgi:hypothetical protein
MNFRRAPHLFAAAIRATGGGLVVRRTCLVPTTTTTIRSFAVTRVSVALPRTGGIEQMDRMMKRTKHEFKDQLHWISTLEKRIHARKRRFYERRYKTRSFINRKTAQFRNYRSSQRSRWSLINLLKRSRETARANLEFFKERDSRNSVYVEFKKKRQEEIEEMAENMPSPTAKAHPTTHNYARPPKIDK